MSVLDFPASPSVGQIATPSNGFSYQWDGAVWTLTPAAPGQAAGGDLTGTYPNPQVTPAAKSKWAVSGSSLTPVDATKTLKILTATMPQLTMGGGTQKAQIEVASTNIGIAFNHPWGPEDLARPSWLLQLETDADGVHFYHRAAGAAAGAGVEVLKLDGVGNLTALGRFISTKDYNQVVCGAGTTKGRLNAFATGSYVDFTYNIDSHASVLDDAAKPSWIWRLDGDDNISAYRAAAGSTSFGRPFLISGVGDLVISGPNATKASGTAWGNPSDDRLKKDVLPYATGLSAILALDPITFKFNGSGGSQDGMPGMGFSAQAVQSVMPEMVSSRRATIDDAETDLLMLDTTALPLALVNAVKELDARLRAVEAK